MKTRPGFLIFLLLSAYTLQSQEMNRKIIDERTGSEILVGYCNREGLMQGDFGKDYDLEYNDYIPDRKVVKKISKRSRGVSIAIILGTWCPDSREQVPRFYKILDEAGIGEEILTVICVDGYKQFDDTTGGLYDIEKVPTFIFIRDGMEIGRIVESPEESLEKDFLSFL